MNMPIPKDIPLGLPAPEFLLEVLVVVSFLAHIFFVALMVGGSILTFVLEKIGAKRPECTHYAHLLGASITVNKSLAVVLGVAPLLILNTLYTPYFYAANALTGTAWIGIVPLVIAAFLLSYAHEYSWKLLSERRGLHLSLAASAAGLFAFIPLIFLTNINLMLYPEFWPKVRGFVSALLLPNVLPRYLHFLTACIALTGLFMVWMLRRHTDDDEAFAETGKPQALRLFYSIAFVATCLQVLFGPFLYLTLPAQGITWSMTGVILAGAAAALVVMWLLWREVRAEEAEPGARFWPIVLVLSGVVALMATGRHMIRETSIEPHRTLVAAKTEAYMMRVHESQDYVLVPGGLGAGDVSPGGLVFRKVCASCHARDTRLVGPPLSEIVPLYAGNPEGIIAWTKAPGRKRMDYPAMPPQVLPDEDLKAVAEYILEGD